MRSIEFIRRTVQRLTMRAAGLQNDQPRLLVGQKKALANESDILALPLDVSELAPIQILDPASPSYGAFVFMLDFDPLDGGSVLG